MRIYGHGLKPKAAALAALAALVLFCSLAHAGALGVADAPMNQEISIVSPPTALNKGSAPKKLLKYYAKYAPYIKIYRFTVTPGEKYTFYMHYPPDMEHRYAYLSGANPNSDHAYSITHKGKNPGGFVIDGHTPWKLKCSYLTRRNNITIDPDSQAKHLYVVYTAGKPGLEARILLKYPADPDGDVKSHTGPPPYCPERKGYYWGQVWERPFLLVLYPGEERGAAVPAVQPRPLSKLDTPQPTPRAAAYLSGAWDLVDSKGKSNSRLVLTQNGNIVTGTAHYETGTVPVGGTVAGGLVKLTFSYNDPEVMAKWISPEVARQISGIKGLAEFTVGPDPNVLEGTLYGWQVHWDARNKVTNWHHGGTPGAAQKNPPRPATMKRSAAKAATQAVPDAGASLSTGKPSYSANEPIVVHFSGFPGNGTDWLTVVEASTPANKYGQWFYTKGQKEGSFTFKGLRAGSFEARGYFNWPSGGYDIKARHAFTVGAGGPAGPDVAIAAPGQAVSGSCRWIDYIKSGRPFEVVFDTTAGKFDDEGFTGDHRTDPMGTLKAGETYRVVYQNGKFTCTGYNELYSKPGTFTYGGTDPNDGLISLWGRVYTFDGQGRVWDPDYGLVGHMKTAH